MGPGAVGTVGMILFGDEKATVAGYCFDVVCLHIGLLHANTTDNLNNVLTQELYIMVDSRAIQSAGLFVLKQEAKHVYID